MSITRERIARAVENYIPTSLSTSLDADTNVIDPEEVFKKVQTMVSTALVLDPNAFFYLVSIVLSEIFDSAESLVADMQELVSQEVLLSAEGGSISGITDTSDLQKASAASAGISSGSSEEALSSLKESLAAFQTNQLKGLIQKRNPELVRKDVASLAASSKSSLDEATTIVARVMGALAAFEASDVKTLAVSQVAASVTNRIEQIRSTIDSSSPEEQAALAEDFLVDLVAAESVLNLIAGAEDPKGTVVIPATPGGSTDQTYLTLQGDATLVPRTYVAKGDAGAFFIDHILASTGGSASATEISVTASIKSEDTVAFPITVSDSVLIFSANGVDESVVISANTYNTVSSLVDAFNSSATLTTAVNDSGTFRVHAFNSTETDNPVGKDSTLSLKTGSSSALLSTLSISADASSTGVLVSPSLVETVASLSSYTIPVGSFVTTLAGTSHKVVAVSASTNTLTVSPGIPVKKVGSGSSATYTNTPFSYVLSKTSGGSLFESGSSGSTSPSAGDPDGTPVDSFLLSSATTSGSTDTTRLQDPNEYTQAITGLAVTDYTLISVGQTISIGGETLTVVDSSNAGQKDSFEVGSSNRATAENIAAAINLSSNSFTKICVAELQGFVSSTLILRASYYTRKGTLGNSISISDTSAGIFTSSFSGGKDKGSTWPGLGVAGTLDTVIRISGSDGTNKKEWGSAGKLGERKWYGSGGVAYKSYGSRSSSNWYIQTFGQWGKKIAESTGSVGDAASPSTSGPTNLFAFDGSTVASWESDPSQIWFNGTGAGSVTAGHYFVMLSWSEKPAPDVGVIRGPYDGVGPNTANFPSPPHYSGVGGTSFYIYSAAGSSPYQYEILSPFIDSDGDGDADGSGTGLSWLDKGWEKTNYTSGTYLTLFGYIMDPDKFVLSTGSGTANGFNGSYLQPNGITYTPQAGDYVFYEWVSGGSTVYRGNQEISSIDSNIECSFNDTGGTLGSNDFTYRIDDPWKAKSPALRTSVKYTFVRDTATSSKTFFVSGASSSNNLTSKGVVPGDLLYISTSGSNQGWYKIASVISDGELLIDGSASGNAPDNTAFKTSFAYPENVSWEIRSPDYQQRMTDPAATFLSNGVSAGDTLVITSSTPDYSGIYDIAAVESETSLRVVATNPSYNGGPFTISNSAAVTAVYYVPQHDDFAGIPNHFFHSPSSYFYGVVFSGDILNVGGVDYLVDSIENSNTIKIDSFDSGPDEFSPYFDSAAFTVRRGKGSGIFAVERTNEFRITIASEPGVDVTNGLLDVNGIAVDARMDINTSAGTNYKDGFLKIKTGSSAGTYAISSVGPVSSGTQVIFIDTFLPISTGGDVGTLDWEILAGKTTARFVETGSVDKFKDSSSSGAFYTREPRIGDILVVEGQGSFGIKSVESDTELTLDAELPEALTSLRYSLLPSEYPQIGDELVIGSYRSRIKDIRLATKGSSPTVERAVLELESALPLSLGSALQYFVVKAGGDPNTTLLVDLDPNVDHDEDLAPTLVGGFLNPNLGNLAGLDIQLSSSGRIVKTQIKGAVDATTLSLVAAIDVALANLFYRIVTGQAGKADTLAHSGDASAAPISGDALAIWQTPETLSVSSSTQTRIEFSPEITSGLSSLDFAVTRGGSPGYARYLLLLDKMGKVQTRLAAYTFSDLNLRLGEVISFFGADKQGVSAADPTASIAATAPDDGDGDSLTNRFDVSVLPSQNLDLVRVGDRLSLSYEDSSGEITTKVCWVYLEESVFSTNPLSTYDALTSGGTLKLSSASVVRCVVVPEIPVTSDSYRIVNWKAERSSISFAIYEATRVRLLAEEMKDIVEKYTVEASDGVDAALSFLRSEGYDKMADLLTTGQLTEFFGVDHTASSYQESMVKAVQEIGSLLLELKNG